MSEYQWNNRLVIVIADDLQQSNYVDQLKEFQKEPAGLAERKLLVFYVRPKKYKKGIESDAKWQQSKKLYQQYKRADTPFEVILIGLDGGIKTRRTDLFKINDLFAVIDGMPMRRAEIRNK